MKKTILFFMVLNFSTCIFAQTKYFHSSDCVIVTDDDSSNSFIYSPVQSREACKADFAISSTNLECTSNGFTSVYNVKKVYYLETKEVKMNILDCTSPDGTDMKIFLKDYIDGNQSDEIVFMAKNSSKGVSYEVNLSSIGDLSKTK